MRFECRWPYWMYCNAPTSLWSRGIAVCSARWSARVSDGDGCDGVLSRIGCRRPPTQTVYAKTGLSVDILYE